jgi:hypothetical protein
MVEVKKEEMKKARVKLKKQDLRPEVLVQMNMFIGCVIVFLSTG